MCVLCVCAGAWLKSSLGYIQREGKQLTLTYIAPQLGYWVAAMSPINTGINFGPFFLSISQLCSVDSAFFDPFIWPLMQREARRADIQVLCGRQSY